MAVRLLSTTHLLVHQQAVQLVGKVNKLVEQKGDMDLGIGISGLTAVLAIGVAIYAPLPEAWASVPWNVLATAGFTFQKQRLDRQLANLSLGRAYLNAPDIDAVITTLGEGRIELAPAEITPAAVKTIAACNPDIE